MSTLKVHGRRDPTPARPELARGLPEGAVRPKHSAVVDVARAGATPIRLPDVADDDIVELETQDGIRLWLRAESVREDFGLEPSRDASEEAVTLPGTLRVGAGGSRGVGEWALKGLKVFGVDIAGSITDFVRRRVESRLQPGLGLFRCTPEGPSALDKPGKLTGGEPALVFLHGTASSNEASFGSLWADGSSAPIQRLLTQYGGRVLAFQHRTLSESPIQNTLELVEALVRVLGKGARLHLVSHSRGGLLGELLARANRIGAAPFDAEDAKLFGADRDDDRKALRELGKALTDSGLVVERFVRVACPARGTTLADRRLDRYFSVITNLAGMIPLLKGSVVYDGLTGLLAGVLKKRTDPKELPGLEAMMPDSPLVALLNRPDVESRADLHVLGGDLEGTGVLGRLKALATDFFYLEDHDLVVNTPSMLGGVARAGEVRYWIDTGGNVTHFNYFRNPATVGRLVSALQEPDKADFRTYERKTTDEVRPGDYRKRAATPQPVVLVLPGIMGSNLSVNDGMVWMDYLRLGRGGLADIGVDAKKVTATSLVGGSYKRLLAYLSATHEVVPFPYDWRVSVDVAAESLRVELAKRVKAAAAAGQPVRILAHSMGGLVVRAMLGTARGRAVWEEMCQQAGARFVMLGTPNAGSHSIAALLMGRDALARKLALLDVRHSQADLMRIIARFDGVLNLLPHDGDLDLLDTKAWQRIYEQDTSERGLFSSNAASSKSAGFGWTVPAREQLVAARAVRDLLRQSRIDPAHMIYVAGVAPATPCAIEIDEAAAPGRRVKVLATARGDGRVPWSTGIPKALVDAGRTYYMDVVHGDMASVEDHFPALVDLLMAGATAKLAQAPPGGRAAEDKPFVLRSPEPDMRPDLDDLRAAALGGSQRIRTPKAVSKVRVRVVHANLARATSPVLVGHYREDVLVSAERQLDKRLNGRLLELHMMDLYPGAPETAVVVLNEPTLGAHPGAIVVGLGLVGALTPGTLLRTLTHGLTAYGAQCVGLERRRRQRSPGGATTVSAPVTTILIGSAEGGVSVSDSLFSILRAVAQANERLRRPAEGEGADARPDGMLTATIDQVDIIELYEDRAIQATKALARLGDSAWIRDAFILEEQLVRGSGGEWRASYEEPPGWWQRIRITGTRRGSLRFEASTQRGRAPARLAVGQLRSVETFLGRAALRPRSTANDTTLGYTLFDMLVPPEFKEYAPERQRLALQVDVSAAALPWELLHDRYDRGARPLSVETGMIRQLLDQGPTDRRREPPKDTALVIGNPRVRDPRFPPLPGAEREAAAVAERLQVGDYNVTCLLAKAADPRSVIVRLHEKPWRVLHFAAHGVFRFRPRKGAERVTGVVLDNGLFLTPAQLTQMTYVPELVFVNCCHLGAAEGDARGQRFHHLAANVATEFIRMGARAVVAAGWAVNDAAALDFAVRFYGEMLGGTPFGDAVRLAREEVYQAYAHTNTWGAYQCYGDAGYILRKGVAPVDARRFVDPRELADLARSIAQRATASSEEESSSLARQLDEVLERCRPEWRADAGLCAAVGSAYAELGEFEKALEYHRRSLSAESAEGPVRGLEQLANLTGRQAVQAITSRSSRALVKTERLLDALAALGGTSERQSLRAGMYKRRAMIAAATRRRDRKARVRMLERMVEEYANAVAVARRDPGADVWYPLTNEVAGRIVLSWARGGVPDAPARKALAAGLDELQHRAESVEASAGEFWPLTRPAEHALLAALRDRKLEPGVRMEIEKAHDAAAQRGRSQRQRKSVADQVQFFMVLAGADLPARQRKPLVTELAALYESLRDKNGPGGAGAPRA